MNKTVVLVNEWGAFEKNHPEGTLEEFCRHYLARHKAVPEKGTLVGGVVPGFKEGLLMKLIGRSSKLHMAYANMALKNTGLNQIEEFGMLITIKQEQNPKKTEVIYANLFELSSGTDMLNRLKKRGLLKEYADKEDKRSKRLSLTAKGEEVVALSLTRIHKTAILMASSLTDDDKELCIQLLKHLEIKFSALLPLHKGKDFDEVFQEVMKTPQPPSHKRKVKPVK